MNHVILAGGSGTRFWPYSRKDNPKQLLKIIGEKSMIRLTYERLERLSSSEKVYVVASAKLCELIRVEIPEIPENNFIVEPSGKNTAPAIALAAIHIASQEDDLMGVYPADHLIKNDAAFQDALSLAETQVRQEPSLVTMGITPTYPATGYGYIQYLKHASGELDGVNKVQSFTEKPGESTAKQYLKSGTYLWNSGMFVWKAGTILQSMKAYMPDLFERATRIGQSIGSRNYNDVLVREWKAITPESIDYGILENSPLVYTVKGGFGWSDVGSWKSLFDELTGDANQNVLKGLVRAIDTNSSLVMSPDRLTAVIGLENIAVINVNGITLVMPLNQAERVKEIVDLLKSEGREDVL